MNTHENRLALWFTGLVLFMVLMAALTGCVHGPRLDDYQSPHFNRMAQCLDYCKGVYGWCEKRWDCGTEYRWCRQDCLQRSCHALFKDGQPIR